MPDAITDAYEAGLELIAAGRYFEAHEALEEAWRASDAAERDFFQGLVHVSVAWYQAGRGNRVGCERQLEKAGRRLGPYAPRHRDLDVARRPATGRARRRPLPRPAGGHHQPSPRKSRARLTATFSHQNRSKKSSRPMPTRIAPLTVRTTA